MTAYLGVNVDHVATLREARKTIEPTPLDAALIAKRVGAHNITVHLREDRRHIQNQDLLHMKQAGLMPCLNLEMALTPELIGFAKAIQPKETCIVPEKRHEITTEGGFCASQDRAQLQSAIKDLHSNVQNVSVFIDPLPAEIHACHQAGATTVELHTGPYANTTPQSQEQKSQLHLLQEAATLAASLNLRVNLGHGLTYHNIHPLIQIQEVHTFNIGHSIISRSVFVGIEQAVREMLSLLQTKN